MGEGTTTAMMQEEHQGVLPRAIRSIFQRLERQQEESTVGKSSVTSNETPCGTYEYDVRVQFLEIYGEEIRDLLNPHSSSGTKLSVRDVGNEEPEVVGATMHKVESAEEALLCLTSGMVRRVTASTAMNEGSSRSHAILSMVVTQSTPMNADPTKQQTSSEHVQSKTSRFNFVDLAGSERQKRTQATGQRLKEGININQGLLVLGNVISALGDPKKRGSFVPYRDSKLTRLLKGSLGGNHKTLMIACVSPSSSNMEETLNCLRYANRAKNIQNHAIVNLDSTSAMVAELKAKIQRLAIDLIKVKSGKEDECTFPMSVVEALAGGGDAGDIAATTITQANSGLSATAAIEAEVEAKRLRAENESYRIQLESYSKGRDPADALQENYMKKVANYEREIAILKNEIQTRDDVASSSRRGRSRTRSESPELSRLKSQMFGSMSKSNTLDAEVKAEEEAAKHLSDKYLKYPVSDGQFIDDDEERDQPKKPSAKDKSAALDADLFELSNSISAKEELIHQLQATQEKFETMREFYEEKLKEMEGIVAVKEAESEKLSEELKRLGLNHSRGVEVAERLREKKAQVAELRRKQSELSRLTSVASRNETQIARLKNDVQEMKTKKIDLQKQITSERKTHMTEVKKMKKESMQKDRELNKAKREVNKMSQEASKAQKIAKARLEQMNQLKSKYKDSEKRLRMKTVKQGVLKKAGLDPIIFGRRQPEDKKSMNHQERSGRKEPDVDKLRDFFDQRVADVSRRENLAEKLAQEWEEHLELTIQKEELLKSEDTEGQDEALRALASAVKYREERIRQLASKLGKREKSNKENIPAYEELVFNKEFDGIVGNMPLENGADVVAKVLFGMVVRERRRIASLARTASSLDEKVQETETALADKEAAFNAFVGEQRYDAAALAQNQQQHILSLMEMVKEGHTEDMDQSTAASSVSSNRRLSTFVEDGNSRLLVLANERIDVLERQLTATQLTRDAIQKHQEREKAALEQLQEKTKECDDLMEDVDDLRSALHHIRAEVAFDRNRSLIDQDEDEKKANSSETIQDIVTGALHSTSGGKSRGRKSSIRPRRRRSPESKKLSIETDLHSSDSESVPDWAEDIMADLAIIAEGKIPAILLESPEILEAEKSFEVESKDDGDVFDRLTNPETFTGVQKQSFTEGQKQRSKKSNRPNLRIDATDSYQSADEPEKKKEVKKKSKEKTSKKVEVSDRNVFDRLLSPSNLTGTQKQRFDQIQEKKGRTIDKAIENKHVSVRRRSPKGTEFDVDESEAYDEFCLESKGSNVTEARSESQHSAREDYTRQDVFDRLSKTITEAKKGKLNTNIAEKMLDDILSDDDSQLQDENNKFEPKLEKVKEYVSQDVFDRLLTTTTESYAQKKNIAADDEHNLEKARENSSKGVSVFKNSKKKSNEEEEPSLDDILADTVEPKLEKVKEYVSQDVFDRLLTTTTQSYAQKKNSFAEDELNIDKVKENNNNDVSERKIAKKKKKKNAAKEEPIALEKVKEYTKVDVFDRLLKTTTTSYEKKKNSTVDDAHINRSPVKKYTKGSNIPFHSLD